VQEANLLRESQRKAEDDNRALLAKLASLEAELVDSKERAEEQQRSFSQLQDAQRTLQAEKAEVW